MYWYLPFFPLTSSSLLLSQPFLPWHYWLCSLCSPPSQFSLVLLFQHSAHFRHDCACVLQRVGGWGEGVLLLIWTPDTFWLRYRKGSEEKPCLEVSCWNASFNVIAHALVRYYSNFQNFRVLPQSYSLPAISRTMDNTLHKQCTIHGTTW